MKKIILILSLSMISVSSSAKGYVLEAKPVAELLKLIQAEKFQHREDGLAFGFNSIKSCLYVSENFAILKNYCIPKKDYPAKGYTIISLKFGIIDLYQEKTDFFLKRDIQISTFPDVLKDYLDVPTDKLGIDSLNQILEKLYYLYGPACWSTNASYQTGQPAAACTAEEVLHFAEWATETQALNGDEKTWYQFMETIESSILR